MWPPKNHEQQRRGGAWPLNWQTGLSKIGCQEWIGIVQTENKIKSHPDKINKTAVKLTKAQAIMQKFLYGDYRQLISKADLSKDNSSFGGDICLCDFSLFYHLAPINM